MVRISRLKIVDGEAHAGVMISVGLAAADSGEGECDHGLRRRDMGANVSLLWAGGRGECMGRSAGLESGLCQPCACGPSCRTGEDSCYAQTGPHDQYFSQAVEYN